MLVFPLQKPFIAFSFPIALELTEIFLLTPYFIEVVHRCSPGNIIIQVIIPIENIKKKVHGKYSTVVVQIMEHLKNRNQHLNINDNNNKSLSHSDLS